MLDANRTTTMLLEGLFDADNATVWSEFDTRYRTILIAFARRLGLNDDDAADVAQETLVQFVKEYREGKYDRERSRLRAWLVGIARYRVLAQYRRRAVRREVGGRSAMVDLRDDAQLTSVWDAEQRAAIVREAMSELRSRSKASPRTIRAFELLAVHGMSVDQVADELGLSRDDVYQAKSRTARQLKRIVRRLERAYEEER